MPENAKNAGLLFAVLCLNKEQQKHCVVRDLNLKTVNAIKTYSRIMLMSTPNCKKNFMNYLN